MPVSLLRFTKKIQKMVVGCPRFEIQEQVVATIIDFAKKTEFFYRDISIPGYQDAVSEFKNNELTIDTRSIDAQKKPYTLTEITIGKQRFTGDSLQQRTPLNNIENRSEIFDNSKKYYYFKPSQKIVVFPIEDGDIQAAPDFVHLRVVLVPLDSITEIDDEIFDDWHETIEQGAMARLFRMPKKDWTDKSEATASFQLYEYGTTLAAKRVFQKMMSSEIKRTEFI